MSAAMIRAEGVGRRFRRTVALNDVDLEVRAAESIALLGPNGAGKTTLLRLLAGIDRPTSGTVTRQTGAVGWVPQRPAVYQRLTVRENLCLFVELVGGNNEGTDTDNVDILVERADLGPYIDRQARHLSTGTLQRLNVAVALAGKPTVLLLDEPTATLSPDQRVRLWTWLEELRRDQGLALVFSTQSVDEAHRQAYRCVVIAQGREVFHGTPDELASTCADETDIHTALATAFMRLAADEDRYAS